SLVRIAAVGVTTVLFVLLMEHVGMIVGTGLFLFVMLRLVERYSFRRSLGVAVGGAAGTYLLFVHWLRVPFPAGPFGF
ncbi:MAG TPA: tripartite tricarboxylate transporter TctB family protein, partial [Thermodesulfobacteriota bacterium]